MHERDGRLILVIRFPKFWILIGALVLISAGCLTFKQNSAVHGFAIVSSVQTQKKVIALTFDDGPDPLYTKQILQELQRYKAHGTFFLIGKHIETAPDILLEMVKSGQQLGNHGYSHTRYVGCSREFILNDLEKNAVIIRRITGVSPRIVRPPGGRISPELIDVAREHGFKVVTWTNDSEDWKLRNANLIAHRVLSHVGPGQIILMHDGGGKRSETVKALRIILDTLSSQGYQFVTMDELLAEESS